jgi:predicted Zn-dependent protease
MERKAMKYKASEKLFLLSLSLLVLVLSVAAQNQKPAQTSAKNKPAASQAAGKSALAEDENPDLIGKRNINKHQINFYSFDKEVAIGRQFAQEVDREAKIVDDPIVADYINKVGQNIVLHSDAKVPFTIKVVDSDEINAFALPGGFFYVNKGLILAADNEAEIAGVMSHEIAHVAARHGVEQASKGQIVNWGTLPLIFLGGWGGFAVQQGLGIAIPLGFLKFSRGAEEEADRLGVQYLYASGYDPSAMGSFFEKLLAKEKKKPGTLERLFSSHPIVSDRITKVNSLIARFPDRSEYVINTSEFSQVKNRLISITNASRSITGRGAAAESDSKRPTLKRRQPPAPDAGTGSTDTSSGETSEKPTERPTLRKKTDN